MTDHATIKQSLRDRLLSLLWDQQWHPNWELAQFSGVRYGARVLELRRLGYVIETKDLAGDDLGKEYRLASRQTGTPQGKRVQVYLDEADAAALASGNVTRATQIIVTDALASFRARKTML